MKNITKQYQALLEGKMSRDNFVRNARMQFPQYVSPVTSVDDAIKILKSKRIIGENTDLNMDRKSLDRSDPYTVGYDENHEGYKINQCPFKPGSEQADLWKDGWLDAETEKQMSHDEDTYRRETDGMWDDKDDKHPAGFPGMTEKLNEAAEKIEGRYKEATGKDEYDRFRDLDNVNFTTFLRAVAFEVEQNPTMNDSELPALLEKVAKKMKKDPNAYRELVIANYADIAKQDESLKMIPVNGKNHTDKENSMEKIKGQEVAKATPSSKKENKKGKPKGVKEMAITPKKAKGISAVMDMPGKEKVLESIISSIKKTLNEDSHFKYTKGHDVTTPDGPGKVVSITGGTITVKLDDGEEKDYQVNILDKAAEEKNKSTNEITLPGDDQTNNLSGIDLGGSFEKMKTSMGDESKFEDLMKKYDWYAEMSDDSRKWDAQKSMEYQLKTLAKSIGAEKATEIWNRYAPQDRKISAKFFTMMEKKDKYAKLKEFLKKTLKEKLSVTVPKCATDPQKKAAVDKARAKAKVSPDTPIDVIEA